MIGIKINGSDEILDTPVDASISFKLESPLLGDGERISPGSYSFPFDLPAGDASPKNSALLKNPDIVENNEAFFKITSELYFQGVPFKRGILKATSYEDNKASCAFLFGLSQVSEDFKTTELRDAVSEQVVIDNTAITKKIFLQRRDANDYDITINGKSYTGDSFEIETAINADAANALDTGDYVPYCIRHSSGSSPLGEITGVYLEIKLVKYETIVSTPTFVDATDPLLILHVTPNDDFINYFAEAFDMDTYYDGFDAFFTGYITGVYPDDRFRLPMMLNGAKYKDSSIDIEDVVNHTIDSASPLRNDANFGIVTFDEPFTVVNKNSLQPFAMLKWVLDKIGQYFGFGYEGDFYEDPTIATTLIFNSNPLDEPQEFLGTMKFIFWRRSFNMNELVPKMKVPEFFGALQSRYNLAVYYNEVSRRVRLQYREPLAKSYAFDDITPLSSPVQSVVDNRLKGVRLVSPKDDKDFTSQQESFSIGEPEKDMVVRAGRLFQMSFFALGNHGRSLVRVERNYKEEFDLRLFSYRGIVSTTPFDHPWAHVDGVGNDRYDIQSIYEDRWKYWLRFMLNRLIVKVTVLFHFRTLRAFDWELKRRFDRSNYMVKSISVKLTNKGVSASEVELITMK